MNARFTERESCVLPPSKDAPAAARRFVAAALGSRGITNAFADLPLLTSELVTNAVRHAESDVALSLAFAPDRVRLEVADRSRRLPVVTDGVPVRSRGWGMHIVEQLATRWGLEPDEGGKTVWCEVSRSA